MSEKDDNSVAETDEGVGSSIDTDLPNISIPTPIPKPAKPGKPPNGHAQNKEKTTTRRASTRLSRRTSRQVPVYVKYGYGSPRLTIVDGEEVKAEIYRDFVGRRNAFDVGVKMQKKQKQSSLLPSLVTNDYDSKRLGPQIQISTALLGAPADNSLCEQEQEIIETGVHTKLGLTKEQVKAFREVFELFDSNGGGTIDADELDQTLRSVGICLTPDEIKDVLITIDVDGNGEIDFCEFLHLMTNTERFLETVAFDQSQRKNRENMLFDALTMFMKKSALNSMDEIVGYYHTKYKRVHVPHVVNHYAAGARLIGLTEKQLKDHLEQLKATSAGRDAIKSPYAQPLHIVASATNVNVKVNRSLPLAPRRRGMITLRIKMPRDTPVEDCDQSCTETDDPSSARKYSHKTKFAHYQGMSTPTELGRGGWVSQRTEHIEVRLPPVHLKKLVPFDELTAEDLPAIRSYVNTATRDYTQQRRKAQIMRNLKHWKTLNVDVISPAILRNHFRTVFSHYSAINQNLLPVQVH